MVMTAILPLFALAAAPLDIVAPRAVTLTSRTLRVADVVRGAGPLSPTLRQAVVATFPAAPARMTLSRTALASLVRRRLPGLPLAAGERDGAVDFILPCMPVRRSALRTAALVSDPAIKRGEGLWLTSRAGPVRIERQVTALQPSRGKRVFVRDPDGQVFAVRVAATEAAR